MNPGHVRFTAELVRQDDPEIGQELILVRFEDGRVEQLRLHDYERLYSLPGVYEQIVTERLQCSSPWVIAGLLGSAADSLGWERGRLRVLDVAAGNGVSGEALAQEGLGVGGRYGTDIVEGARVAALRDRPGIYDQYVTLDLLRLTGADRALVGGWGCALLCCVAPVGDYRSALPPAALAAAASLLSDDALIAYMHDPAQGEDDPVTADLLGTELADARLLERRRYVHRRTVNGRPFEMDGVVWRVKRGQAQ